MRKTTIIHLSDIHFDNSEISNELLTNLQKDIKQMEHYVGSYDLLVLTGDCVDKGHVELYNVFSEKINTLLKTSSISKKRAIIVPGNHDCTRENQWLSALKQISNNNVAEIANRISKDVSPLFSEFNEFIVPYSNKLNGIGVKYFKTQNMVVRVILLNSSWSTLVDNTYGHLLIGDEQLEKIKSELDKRKQHFDITIACLHHPLDWFTYEERIKLQEFLYEKINVDILLHGHIHDSSYECISNMDMSSNKFCTGISYHKTGENCSRKDGMRYSIYEIDFDTRTINVYLRATNQNNIFVDDNRLYSKVNKDGFFTLPLGSVRECIMPFSNVDYPFKNNIFLSRDIVQRIMDKEELLFKFYRGMEDNLEEHIIKNLDADLERYKKDKFKQKSTRKLSKQESERCIRGFYKEEFGIYCMFVLSTLNALFFTNHQHVRFLLRIYNRRTNCHEATFAEGIHSTREEIEKVKNFKWKEGMIYKSFQTKTALLQSKNKIYHQAGNSAGIWKDYLTIAVSGIEVRKGGELIPLLSLNIATDIIDNESCLQALALSSIYDKIQEVFKLFSVKVYDLVKLYEE